MNTTPTRCVLALIQAEQFPNSYFPAMTTSFKTDDMVEAFTNASEIKMEIDPVTEARSAVTLNVVHPPNPVETDDEEPVTKTISHELSAGSAKDFMDSITNSACFFWILSTPSYEARALVNAKTHEVVQRHIIGRTIH